MKKHILSVVLLLAIGASAFAQVNIDKSINLSGSGADGKVTGIKQVTVATDAVSAEVLQKGTLVFAATNASSGTNYDLSLNPSITSYPTGLMLSFIATVANTGSLTLNVNGLGTRTVKKYVTGNLS